MELNILLACSAGMSTLMLERSIENYYKKNGMTGRVEPHGSETAKGMVNEFEIFMLGPQVSYLQEEFEELVARKIPVVVIEPAAYALANSEKVIATAK
ncbi:MAG: hypothetical protein K4H23_00085 [Mollicutes bacterium PWAP]|nr:hypothetical protein [Mollicutes bacterium PWAP]